MTENPILAAIKRFRGLLLEGNTQSAARMLDEYAKIFRSFEPNLRVILDEIAEEGMSPELLFEQNRMEGLLAQVAVEIERFASVVDDETRDRQRVVIDLASKHAKELTDITLGDAPEGFTRPTWADIDAPTIESLVGLTAEGEAFGDELARIGGNVVEALRDALIQGVATGRNPVDIARSVRDQLNGRVGQFLTIARTAEMQAYRGAQLMVFEENEDVIAGWRWFSSLTTGTCLACLSLHGKFFPVGSPFESHFNCRCVPVPETKSYEELGYPDAKDTRPDWQTGEEWLRSQPEAEQLKAFGKARLAMWQSGEVELSDFAERGEYAGWGGMWFERSATNASAFARQRKGIPVGEGQLQLPFDAKAEPASPPTPAPAAPTEPETPKPQASKPPTVEVADAFDIQVKGILKRDVQRAHKAIAKVHVMGGNIATDPPLPIKTKAIRAQAQYVYRSYDLQPLRIDVGSQSKDLIRAHVIVHETGHYIHDAAFSAPGEYATEFKLTQGIFDAMEKSERVNELRNYVGAGMEILDKVSGKTTKLRLPPEAADFIESYLLTKEELFARGYAQWITIRSQDKQLIKQLQTMQPNPPYTNVVLPGQWTDKDFEPIAEEFDKLFKDKGWLK